MSEAPKENKAVPGKQAGGIIVARGGRYYRNARFIIVVMFFGWGLLSIWDGFHEYPKVNEARRQVILDQQRTEVRAAFGREPTELEKQKKLEESKLPHGGYDIPLNRLLGVLLPPASLLVLAWTLYNSRGEYRFSDDKLHIPGHPVIPLNAICKIDQTRWARKGIALLEYELPGGQRRVAKIDDFVYAQDPTDAIMDHIEAYVAERLGDGVHEIAEAPKDTEA